MIDLRSDTLTQPTPAMLEAMFQARVGDDVYEEDPTVQALEQECARRFGMEAGLFCPSGTMTNQIAIKGHTQPLSEVICEQTSHIYLWEVGGIAFHSGASVALLPGDRGRLTAAQVASAIRSENVHYPNTSLISLENTHNRGGGSCYEWAELEEIAELAKRSQIPLHLDGARIFNALVATGQRSEDYGQLFDTISICLSKGLGTPVGSVLVGGQEFIRKCRRIRKAMGGGWRQAGYLAAAGLYALEHHVERLADDHRRARQLAEALQVQPYVETVLPAETNLVIFRLREGLTEDRFLAHLAAQNIKASAFGPQMVRFVTHLQVDDEAIARVISALQTVPDTAA